MRRSLIWLGPTLLLAASLPALAGPLTRPAEEGRGQSGSAVETVAEAVVAEGAVAEGAAHGHDSHPVNATANRHQLTAFLADLDHTVTQFQPPDSPREDRGLSEALQAVRDMSDGQVNALHTALMPVMVSWTVAGAPPIVPDAGNRLMGPYGAAATNELEDVRSKMLEYYDRFLPLTETGTAVDPNFAERLASLRSVAEDLTLDELAQMDSMMAAVPTWEMLLEMDPSSLVGTGGVGSPHGESGALADSEPAVAGGSTIQGHIHPGCKDAAFGPVVTAVLNYLANTGEDLSDIWSNDFFVAAFVGTNAPNIPKIITMVIYYPLKIVAMAATLDTTLYFNCNEFLHQTLMGAHDGEMLELTDLISGTLTLIDVDQNARFDRVDEFHARYRESLIRLAIEEDLGRKGDKRISLFQIPDSLCITTGEHEVCGMLEVAHDIVEETIETARNLGLNVDNAETSFVDGESQQSQGFYKEAYTRYREAYVLTLRANP